MTRYFKQNKVLFVLTVVFHIISSLGYVFIAVLLQQLLDAAIAHDMQMFSRTVLFSFCFFALLCICMYLQSLLGKKMICKIIKSLRYYTFQGVLSSSNEKFEELNTGEYISLITNDVKMVEDNFLIPCFEMIQYVVIFVASLFIMVYFDFIITICVAIAIALMLIVPGFFGRVLENRQKVFSKKLSDFTANLKDILLGYEIIKSYSMKRYILLKFKKSNDNTINSKYDVDKVTALSEGISAFLALMVQVVVLFLAAYFIMIGRTTVGTLLGMIQVSGNLANPLLMIFGNVPKMKSVKPIIEKLNTFAECNNQEIQEDTRLAFDKKISIKGLSFSYDGQKEVLHNINWDIEKGKKYVIVGKSGGGKTTLIKLLTGVYSTYQGNVFYDDIQLTLHNRYKTAQLLSIIHQNIYMFDETIYDNICLHESYTEDNLYKALKESGLDDVVSQIPEGIRYNVGENGSNLSGGQRQRIAVARALIRNKPILILDEGTSAIDMQTAYEIENRLLKMKDLTVITITHNMKRELLEKYDKVLYMKDGTIVEKGTFHDLINANAAFSKYYQ